MKKYLTPIIAGLLTGLTVLALNINGSPEEIKQLFNQPPNDGLLGGGAFVIQNYKPVTPSDGSVATSSRFVGDLEPDIDNSFNLGTSARSWRNIFASGTMRLGGNLLPNLNNTYDIGAYGNAWNDIFASGTSRLVTALVGNGVAATPSLSFISDTNTGMYSGGEDNVVIAVNSASNYIQLSISQILSGAGGTEALPFFARAGDPNTGFYYDGDESLAITANGNRRFSISDSGSIANFYDAANTPLVWINSSGGIGASGTSYMAGILSPTNNGSDLGASGNAWKDVFTSGTLYLGHTVSGGNNAYDLGSPTSSWRNFYASGTIRANRIMGSGNTPGLSTCGTTPSIVGTDTSGKVTIGTGVITACTVTFAATFTDAPACVVSGDNTAVTYIATTSATVLTISSSADMASDVISYICLKTIN